jgi:hypothetical protein
MSNYLREALEKIELLLVNGGGKWTEREKLIYSLACAALNLDDESWMWEEGFCACGAPLDDEGRCAASGLVMKVR